LQSMLDDDSSDDPLRSTRSLSSAAARRRITHQARPGNHSQSATSEDPKARLSFNLWQRGKSKMIQKKRMLDPWSLFFDHTQVKAPGSSSSKRAQTAKEKRVAAWGDAWWTERNAHDSDDSDDERYIADRLAFERAAASRQLKSAKSVRRQRNSVFTERVIRRSVTRNMHKRHNRSFAVGSSTLSTPRSSFASGTPRSGGLTPRSGGLTPPSGGLTPPSGGLTPSSGGLTPPSGGRRSGTSRSRDSIGQVDPRLLQ
jgi:hypothetical protein